MEGPVFILQKTAALFVLPVGTTFLLGLVALAALVRGRRRLAAGILAAALLWLWVWGTPFASALFALALPNPTTAQRLASIPSADAIVVLAGHVVPATAARPYGQISRTADRAWHAARLYRANKAPLVITSGGSVWEVPGEQPAAVVMREFLVELGVPAAAVVVEGQSRNTRENAVNTAAIAKRRGVTKVLLVTSPRHMPRAAATFANTGLTITPASFASAAAGGGFQLTSFVPNMESLAGNTHAVREAVALLVYRLRGWA